LGEVANVYEKELEETLKVITTLLEPIMVLVMGALVGFVVIAMLLPIFQINLMVR
jgi:type II secretory pathway component PulF